MSDSKWGLARPRWELLLCAVGIHKFSHHCASAHHGRDTRRLCFTCEQSHTRLSKDHAWGDHGQYGGHSNANWNEFLGGRK